MDGKFRKKIYAARLKDEERLMKSSSGGVFWALAKIFLNRGDAVVCTIYNNIKGVAELQLVTDIDQLDIAQGSKYMQSNPGNCFLLCTEWLERHSKNKILFCGTGCQAAGFRNYIDIKKLRNRVVIIDLICHGVPSSKIWREYAETLEEKNHGKIEMVSFKDKRNGWNNPYAYVKILQKEVPIFDYVNLFYSGCILRPVCHCCPYATTVRKTDITIGDFWGIEKAIPDFYSQKGTSLVLIQTELGEQLFCEIEKLLEVHRSSVDECLQPNLVMATPCSERRTFFWKLYESHGVIYAMNRILHPTFFQRIKELIKHYI